MSVLAKRISALSKQLWSLHWLMAVCLLCVYSVGIFTAHVWSEAPFISEMITFHKSVAMLVLGLLIVRIGILINLSWQKYSHRQPRFTRHWLQTIVLHTGLYLFMVAVPISGIFYSNTNDRNAVFFGLTLPRLFGVNESISKFSHDSHVWFAYTFLAFIFLHLLEQHKFIQGKLRRFFKSKTVGSK
ncbi:cytochrome b/b6 domain-containing protein [Oscillatoria sp. FACHB-1407]|uniref:cytochrome b n=1 Tax=Oscillatoria sp. FACHB-1407 TaxID=2692847 RepID=UPI001682B1AD|nr:cytochrome b/b6 domain-containing protein [Oscillatoria sp. FACHB-1407]MBD2465986.1 cytochrome b/b6 domain-containing protein [Oscillatoria sp. FACHB-1407]